MDSLICKVKEGCQQLLTFSTEVALKLHYFRASLLYFNFNCRKKNKKLDVLHAFWGYRFFVPLSRGGCCVVIKQNPCQGGIVDFDTWRANPVGQSGEGPSSNYGKSPFLSLEVFIEAIARIGDVQGM
jgi:hypothetical protein